MTCLPTVICLLFTFRDVISFQHGQRMQADMFGPSINWRQVRFIVLPRLRQRSALRATAKPQSRGIPVVAMFGLALQIVDMDGPCMASPSRAHQLFWLQSPQPLCSNKLFGTNTRISHRNCRRSPSVSSGWISEMIVYRSILIHDDATSGHH